MKRKVETIHPNAIHLRLSHTVDTDGGFDDGVYF